MQEEPLSDSVRRNLLDRLRSLDEPQGTASLAELAYRRAREALEKALEEARAIRLQAIEDARETREREMNVLLESLRTLRASAEARIEELVREAEIEAERIRSRAAEEARRVTEQAAEESERLREEAAAIRAAAEEKRKNAQQTEADFNHAAAAIAERLGLDEPQDRSWWQQLTRRSGKRR